MTRIEINEHHGKWELWSERPLSDEWISNRENFYLMSSSFEEAFKKALTFEPSFIQYSFQYFVKDCPIILSYFYSVEEGILEVKKPIEGTLARFKNVESGNAKILILCYLEVRILNVILTHCKLLNSLF